MLAGILVVTVIAELVVSVFCLTRWAGVRRELKLMETHYDQLTDALRGFALAGGQPVELPQPKAEDLAAANAAADVIANASQEDLDAAAEILAKLGIGKQ